MSHTFTGVTLWRRILLVGLTALIASMALSFSAPQEAQAFRNPNVVLPSHQGWVQVRARGNYDTCGIVGPCGVGAYRWSGTQWNATKIGWGTQVYAYPYSGDWMWIWTQRTGWLAIQRGDLETGYSCQGYYCPVF
ncbi:MAG: hypothetical protein JWM86_2256 [Thermoleophilia bacterium]|nr:hypothetical protein [Thermoleophilia bacterium]